MGACVFLRERGAVNEETIRKYIENRTCEGPGENFEITALRES
jgi:hypothetical protein